MENKDFRNALVAIMKEELAQLTTKQREQKKTRKIANRPEGKSLQSIVDEISDRRDKITHLIWIYRFIRHGRKYWENRDCHSWEEYFYGSPDSNTWHWKHHDEPGTVGRAKEYIFDLYEKYFDILHNDLLEKDKINFYDDFYSDFVEYLLWEEKH